MPNLQMYLVGVDAPTFCDQAYIRDRDEKIQAENASAAIKIWLENHKHWIRPDEIHLVKAKHMENDFPTYVFDGKF